MSIANSSVGEAAIAAQDVTQTAVKKPPSKRQVVAIADTSESPEPR